MTDVIQSMQDLETFLETKLVEYLRTIRHWPSGNVILKRKTDDCVYIVQADLTADGSAFLTGYDIRDRVADADEIAKIAFDGRYRPILDAQGKTAEIIVFAPDTPNADDEQAWIYRIASVPGKTHMH